MDIASLDVPAICTACGHVEGSGIVLGPGVRNVELQGNRSRCSKCGAMAIVPDGVWSNVAEAIEALNLDALLRLSRILVDSSSPTHVAEAVKDAPGLGDVAQLLASQGKKDIAVTVIVAILSILVGIAVDRVSKDDEPAISSTYIEAETVVVVDDADEVDVRVSDSDARPETLPNRNDPCWCGSGKRYKRCHRSMDFATTSG